MTKFVDAFERPNANLVGGPSTEPWTWTSTGNTTSWLVRSGAVARKGDSTTNGIGPDATVSTEQQFMELRNLRDFYYNTGNLTVEFRLRANPADAAQYYRVLFTPAASTTSKVGVISVARVGGPAGNTISANYTPPSTEGAGFTFRGETRKRADGALVTTALVNGAVVVTHVDPSPYAYTPGRVLMASYANSGRVDASGNSFYADEWRAGDLIQPSRYKLSLWQGGAETALALENAYLEYVVGETGGAASDVYADVYADTY